MDTLNPDPPALHELLMPITPDEYEAALGLKPVRDSADAVARAFARIDQRDKGSARHLSSMTRDSLGYRLTVDLQTRSGGADTVVLLVKRNGAVWQVVSH